MFHFSPDALVKNVQQAFNPKTPSMFEIKHYKNAFNVLTRCFRKFYHILLLTTFAPSLVFIFSALSGFIGFASFMSLALFQTLTMLHISVEIVMTLTSTIYLYLLAQTNKVRRKVDKAIPVSNLPVEYLRLIKTKENFEGQTKLEIVAACKAAGKDEIFLVDLLIHYVAPYLYGKGV